MRRQRRNFSGPEKIAILREHLIDKVPVSEVCDKHGLNPTLFYHWQKKLFEEGAIVFDQPRAKSNRQKAAEARRIEALQDHSASRGNLRLLPLRRSLAGHYDNSRQTRGCLASVQCARRVGFRGAFGPCLVSGIILDMDRAGTITDEVVVAAAGGSGPAVARLAEALEPQIGLMVMARLHAGSLDLHSVEEVAQSSLVALAAGIHRLQNRTSAGLKVYLSGIVSRQVRDFLRHKPGRERGGPRFASLDSTVFGQSGAGPLHQFLAAQGTAPDDAVERADRLAIVFSALSKLKPHYRRVIILAFFDQLPMPEIGEQLGVSRAAASMLLLRAVKTLRRDLTGSSQIGLGDGHLQRE